jgi:hypothetical protein
MIMANPTQMKCSNLFTRFHLATLAQTHPKQLFSSLFHAADTTLQSDKVKGEPGHLNGTSPTAIHFAHACLHGLFE